MLVLGLHAVQGAAAPGRAARRVAPRARRRREAITGRSTCRRCWPAATRSSTTSTTPPSSRGSRSTGIALLRGWGRLDGEKRVVVGDETIEVAPRGDPRRRHDAGAAADRRPGRGASRGRTARRRPRTRSPASLIVMGGGVVGAEMSQAYTSLGAEVTLIEGERRLLPREEEFACEQVTESLERAGRRHPHGPEGHARSGARAATVTVTLDDGADGDRRRAARRRRPHAAGRGPRAGERSGWRPDGYVEVDEHCRVARPRLALRDRRPQRPRGRSRTWRSTRRRSRATTCSARTSALEHGADGPRLAARDLHRPAGLLGRPHARGRRRRPG